MQAREKSRPRERRGNTEAVELKAVDESSFGESSTRLMRPVVSLVALGLVRSCFGSWRERPRWRFGRFGVVGVATVLSSFEDFRGSIKTGEGDKTSSLGAEASGIFSDGLLGSFNVPWV